MKKILCLLLISMAFSYSSFARCNGYSITQSYTIYITGYWQSYWIDTSHWTVDGLTKYGRANYVWVNSGYWGSYWVRGYPQISYYNVWISDNCGYCY